MATIEKEILAKQTVSEILKLDQILKLENSRLNVI